jgi:hypothetical protein
VACAEEGEVAFLCGDERVEIGGMPGAAASMTTSPAAL